jgi:cytochrome c oxidase assembly protein subunit 15
LLVAQVALGGWVSTNYAVLACSGFPTCNGQWWPATDFGNAFTLLRELGRTAGGELLSFDALVTIHLVHRLFAGVVTAALLVLVVSLWRAGGTLRSAWGRGLLALTLLQLGTGLSNVVLEWPIVAALLHSAGAAALVLLLALLLARSRAPVVAGQSRAATPGLA